MVGDVKYDYWAYPTFVFGKPTGGSILQIGYPPCSVGKGPIELITTGYPPFDVSYGANIRRPEAILVLSIPTP